jgi:porin
VLAGELRLPTNFFDRPGHQLFGFAWSSRTFVALEQDPRVIIPGGPVPIAAQEGSWSLHWNFDQYVVLDPCDATRGWGVFGRAGISDADPNPLAYFLSFGIGGNSPIAGRGADRFGVGWYYNGTSTEIGPIVTQVLNLGDGQGVELFYNIEITPWFHLTPDLQIIDPARRDIDTAYVAALRARIDF